MAAVIVLGGHASANLRDVGPWWWVINLVSSGYSAVSFFFVLSGFVLTYAYQDTEITELNLGPMRQFWRARVARIYPAYLLALVAAAPMLLYSVFVVKSITLLHFLGSALLVPTMLQAWIPSLALAWNMPAWSLSVEAFFYLCFPLIFRILTRVKIWKAMTLVIVILLVTARTRNWISGAGFLATNDEMRHNFAAYFPLWFIPHFAFGVILGRCYLSPSAFTSSVSAWISGLASACVLVAFVFREHVPDWALSDPILVFLFGAIILCSAWTTGIWASVLSMNLFVQLGEASYALYILHWPMAIWWEKTERMCGFQPLASWPSVIAFCALSIAVSYFVYAKIERPARRILLAWH